MEAICSGPPGPSGLPGKDKRNRTGDILAHPHFTGELVLVREFCYSFEDKAMLLLQVSHDMKRIAAGPPCPRSSRCTQRRTMRKTDKFEQSSGQTAGKRLDKANSCRHSS